MLQIMNYYIMDYNEFSHYRKMKITKVDLMASNESKVLKKKCCTSSSSQPAPGGRGHVCVQAVVKGCGVALEWGS